MSAAPASADPNQTRLLQAQLAAMYAVYPGAFAISMTASVFYAGFYWWLHHDVWIVAWLLMRVPSILIYQRLSRYARDPDTASHTGHWLHLFLWGFAYHGLVWGVLPWFFMPVEQPTAAILNALVLLSLITGGLPGVAHRWSAVLVFVLPINLSLFLALLVRSPHAIWYLFLAIGVLLHLVITLHGARAQHRLLAESLRMRFANEDLSAQLREQVAETERLSREKTRFFAAASHDLRQPLHAIALFGAVLDKTLEGRNEHPHAQRLMGAVQTLGESLDTLLDISRLDAGVIHPQRQAVPLTTLFRHLLAQFAARAEAQDLQLRLRATPLWVQTDPQLLERLLANLVENAIKYTPTGGVLVVARQRSQQVWIDVIDTGIGIAPEHGARVFEEFYQVHNPGRDRSRGLGIGLSIVQRLSRLLEHPVTMCSHPGRGSRFRVQLPLATEQVSTPHPPSGALATPQVLPERVLLIDDEIAIAEAVTAFLGTWGVQLEAVRDAAEATRAMQQAAALGQPHEVLICDYRLADGTDGLMVAQALRARFDPALPVLLITGETAPERLQQVRDAGVPVLFKPVDPTTLLRTLAELAPH